MDRAVTKEEGQKAAEDMQCPYVECSAKNSDRVGRIRTSLYYVQSSHSLATGDIFRLVIAEIAKQSSPEPAAERTTCIMQ